jgi:hypothetical protein
VAYISPRDFSTDSAIFEKVKRTMGGDLDLDWMTKIGERASFRPSDPRRGLTLDDINGGGYAPERIPEIVRHNFSMAPRGAILPPGLPSLGYQVNRKSDVWSDLAPQLFEETKSRRWAPARDVPWGALDGRDREDRRELAMRQLSTALSSIGLVCSDVPARWVWRMNQEFHEIKYLLCAQMFDAARMAEAYRKRALYGSGALGVDCRGLDELLKMLLEADSFPQASLGTNLMLFGFVQALARHLEATSDNEADGFLATRLMQDASRCVAYGADHVRSLVAVRPAMIEELNESLDLFENGLVGALGAREMIEPLVLLSGGLAPVASLYRTATREHVARCAAAGLGDRSRRGPLPRFLELVSD